MAVAHYRSRVGTSATERATSTAAAATARGCADQDPERFFPISESTSATRPNLAELDALSVCAGCPLRARARCLREQLDQGAPNQHGVAGGMTKAQRRRYLRTKGALGPEVEAQIAKQLGLPEFRLLADGLASAA